MKMRCFCNRNARVFIGRMEVYMAVCLSICGWNVVEKQLGKHVKAGIACVCMCMCWNGV